MHCMVRSENKLVHTVLHLTSDTYTIIPLKKWHAALTKKTNDKYISFLNEIMIHVLHVKQRIAQQACKELYQSFVLLKINISPDNLTLFFLCQL